jgi:fructose-bisphosphate aldolase class II
MLVNLAKILAPAAERSYAVACFNVFGWEDARAVVDAAAVLGAPVVLAANLTFRQFMPLEIISAMLRRLAEDASIPVCVHLDHCYEIPEVLRAIDAGFTSVMYDGSQLPLADNIAGTREVTRHAHAAGCSVEAEIGSVPYAEGRAHIKTELTRVADAVRISEGSSVDALAISIGNIHRLNTPGAKIDFALLAEIEAAVRTPLVIHGTSGIFEEDIARLVRTRVAKFNIGTVLRQAFGRTLRETLARHPERFDRLEIMADVMPGVGRAAARMIRLLGWDQGAHPACKKAFASAH